MSDITVVYYTSNYLDEKNPYFLDNTKKALLKAAGDLPWVVVSQKATTFPDRQKSIKQVFMGDIGRSHLNIYRQILEGCKAAETKYVAMAEDDILYSYGHFHSNQIDKEFGRHGDVFLYDMNKVSLFTWTKPAMFSFRTKRRVVNQLIAPRQMLIDALEERFRRFDLLMKINKREHPEIEDHEQRLIKYWGDPGRYEDILGVIVRPVVEFYCSQPSVVFSHEYAFGYEFNQGKKKRLGDIRIIELYDWGRAEDVLKLYGRSTK